MGSGPWRGTAEGRVIPGRVSSGRAEKVVDWGGERVLRLRDQ